MDSNAAWIILGCFAVAAVITIAVGFILNLMDSHPTQADHDAGRAHHLLDLVQIVEQASMVALRNNVGQALVAVNVARDWAAEQITQRFGPNSDHEHRHNFRHRHADGERRHDH